MGDLVLSLKKRFGLLLRGNSSTKHVPITPSGERRVTWRARRHQACEALLQVFVLEDHEGTASERVLRSEQVRHETTWTASHATYANLYSKGLYSLAPQH